jgi:hypothetical protein
MWQLIYLKERKGGNIKKYFKVEKRTLDGINKMNRIYFFPRRSEEK